MSKFTGRQTAFAHLVLPFGEAIPTLRQLRRSILRKNRNPKSRNPHLIQLAGETDILVSFDFPRFRELFEENSKLQDRHLSCQWTLCKEFEIKCDNTPAHHCFFTHIRLHRAIYRDAGAHAESLVIDRIVNILNEEGIAASLHATLAWTDLLLAGKLPKGQTQLANFLRKLHEIDYHLPSGRVSPFQRTITLMGFRWDLRRIPRRKHADPYLVRLRASPGQLTAVYKKLCELFQTKDPRGKRLGGLEILLTEGKTDLLLFPVNLDKKYRNIYIGPNAQQFFSELQRAGVEYYETNLAANRAERVLEGSIEGPPPPAPCRCFSWRPSVQLRPLHRDLIPPGIQESVKTVYALMDAALRDPSQCCDILSVVQAAHQALCCLLDDIIEVQKRQYGTEEVRFAWTTRYLTELGHWCDRVESVIDERTTESFHEILTQTSRLGAIRGSVQKLLITADALIKEYIARIAEYLKFSDRRVTPPVLHYGATDGIYSEDGGAVTIPSKYLFTLPLSMPQMWQETSVRIFRRIYRIPFGSLTRDRIYRFITLEREYFKIIRRKIEFNTEHKGLEEQEKEELLRRVQEEEGGIPTESELLADLADCYADLLVRFFGFSSYPAFLVYMVTLLLSSRFYRTAPESIKETYWDHIVQRLLFVLECEEILVRHPSGLLNGQISFTYESIPTSRADLDATERSAYINEMVSDIRFMIQEIRSKPRYESDKYEIPVDVFLRVCDRVNRQSYYKCHFRYMWDFIESISRHGKTLPEFELDDPDFERNIETIRSGYVTDLSAVPYKNAYFSEGFIEEIMQYRLNENPSSSSIPRRNPAGMAALGRSVYLSSYCSSRNLE